MNQDLVLSGNRVFGPQGESDALKKTDTMTYTVVSQGTVRTPISKIVMLNDFEPTIHGESRNYLFLDFHVETRPNSYTLNARPD